MEQLRIKTYCHIKNNSVYINGELAFEYPEANSMHDFLKKAFKHFKPGYAKFYKMDDISKLGFLASEVILKDKPYQTCTPEEWHRFKQFAIYPGNRYGIPGFD